MNILNSDKYLEDVKDSLQISFSKAYSDGFKAGLSLFKNSVRINNILWSHFNYGATTEMDYCNGSTSRGEYLTWDEAKEIENIRLPSKVEFLVMWNNMKKTLLYNTPASQGYWGVYNGRIKCDAGNGNCLYLYAGGCKDENNTYIDSNKCGYVSCIRLWLSDEISDEEALTVKIEIDMDINNRSVRNERILSPVFEAKPKKYKILSHQIITI